MKKNEALRINNATKTMEIFNKDFENMTSDVERKIAMYEARGYVLEIVDNPIRKVSATQKLNRASIVASLLPQSEELGLSEEDSTTYLEMFHDLEAVSFQTAKGFYSRLVKANKGQGSRDMTEVYNYYVDYLKNVA